MDAAEAAEVAIGDAVTYVDQHAVEHQAVVTQVWSGNTPPSVNLVYVSDDESKTDQYGRQIDRATSTVHQDHQAAHGRYWR